MDALLDKKRKEVELYEDEIRRLRRRKPINLVLLIRAFNNHSDAKLDAKDIEIAILKEQLKGLKEQLKKYNKDE